MPEIAINFKSVELKSLPQFYQQATPARRVLLNELDGRVVAFGSYQTTEVVGSVTTNRRYSYPLYEIPCSSIEITSEGTILAQVPNYIDLEGDVNFLILENGIDTDTAIPTTPEVID